MADALKFMIEFVDRVTKPAAFAARAVGRLDAELQKIRSTVAELGSAPALKFSAPAMVGAGRRAAAPKSADPNATGAAQAVGDMVAKAASKAAAKRAKDEEREAKRVEQYWIKAAQRSADARIKAAKDEEREAKRVEQYWIKAAQRSADARIKAEDRAAKEIKRSQDRAAKAAEQARKKQEAAAKKAADASKKAFDKSAVGSFTNSIRDASSASAGLSVLGSAIGTLVNPVTLAAAAFAGLAGAIGLVVFGGAKLALSAEAAKSDTLDMLEAALGSAAAAEQTYASLKGIASELGASQEGIKSLAQQLTAAGIENRALLESAIRSISTAETVVKGSGARVQALIERSLANEAFVVNARQLAGTGVKVSQLYEELAKRTGKGVKQVEAEMKAGKVTAEDGIAALNAVIQKRFGGIAAARAGGFAESLQRMRDGFKRMFENVNVKPFEEAFAKVAKLFDSSTASGKAMTHVVTTVFDTIFRLAGKVIPYAVLLFKGLVLIALKVWNAFRPVGKAIADAFGIEQKSGVDTLTAAIVVVADVVGIVARAIGNLLAHKSVIYGLAIAFAAFTAPIWLAWAAITAVVAGLAAVVAVGATVLDWFYSFADVAVSAAGTVFEAVAGFVNRAIEFLATLPARAFELGKELLLGLARALYDPRVFIEAVSSLASAGVAKFKSIFGIASPSKVMMGMGKNLTAGLAKGIDTGSQAANDNMANVVSLESARAAAQPRAEAGGSSRTIQITVGEGAVQINGSNVTAEELRELVPEMFAEAAERLLLSQGGGEKVA